MKTYLKLYRVVTGGYRWLQDTPRKKCSFFVTDTQTLHHNIYIIITIIVITTNTTTTTINIIITPQVGGAQRLPGLPLTHVGEHDGQGVGGHEAVLDQQGSRRGHLVRTRDYVRMHNLHLVQERMSTKR